jgi:hypothetical protein
MARVRRATEVLVGAGLVLLVVPWVVYAFLLFASIPTPTEKDFGFCLTSAPFLGTIQFVAATLGSAAAGKAGGVLLFRPWRPVNRWTTAVLVMAVAWFGAVLWADDRSRSAGECVSSAQVATRVT